MIFLGYRIEWFKAGDRKRTPLSARAINEIVATCNAFLNLKIERGQRDRLEISDSNAVLTLKEAGTSSKTGTNITVYKLVSVQGNYLTCHTWDGMTEGASLVYVAKPHLLRESLTAQTELGVAYTYAYSAGQDSNNRYRTKIQNSNGATEKQLVLPAWVVGQVIYGIEVPWTGVTEAPTILMAEELSGARQWCWVGD